MIRKVRKVSTKSSSVITVLANGMHRMADCRYVGRVRTRTGRFFLKMNLSSPSIYIGIYIGKICMSCIWKETRMIECKNGKRCVVDTGR